MSQLPVGRKPAPRLLQQSPKAAGTTCPAADAIDVENDRRKTRFQTLSQMRWVAVRFDQTTECRRILAAERRHVVAWGVSPRKEGKPRPKAPEGRHPSGV